MRQMDGALAPTQPETKTILPNGLGRRACEDKLGKKSSPPPYLTHPRNLEHGFDGSRGYLND